MSVNIEYNSAAAFNYVYHSALQSHQWALNCLTLKNINMDIQSVKKTKLNSLEAILWIYPTTVNMQTYT